MKLYDHPISPYAMKVRMILYEKGIAFDRVEVHTRAQAEELRKRNPRAEVPALEDRGAVISDSKVIAEYLEETQPDRPLLPKDPALRAQCRGLELLADTEIDAAMLAFFLFKFFRPQLAESHPEQTQRAEAGVRGHYAELERRLAGRDYLLGEFSRADLALAPHVGAVAFLGLAPGAETPQLAAWHARMNERESVQRTTQEAIGSIGKEPEDSWFDVNRLHWRSDRIEQLLRIDMGAWLLEELAADRGFLPPAPQA